MVFGSIFLVLRSHSFYISNRLLGDFLNFTSLHIDFMFHEVIDFHIYTSLRINLHVRNYVSSSVYSLVKRIFFLKNEKYSYKFELIKKLILLIWRVNDRGKNKVHYQSILFQFWQKYILSFLFETGYLDSEFLLEY